MIHGEDAAGEGSIFEPDGPVGDPHRAVSERVGAVTETGGGDGVGDEGDGGRRTQGDPDHLVGHVEPVEDDGGGDIVPAEGGSRQSRPTMVHRGLSVEEVGDRPHPPVEGGMGLGGRGIAVAA